MASSRKRRSPGSAPGISITILFLAVVLPTEAQLTSRSRTIGGREGWGNPVESRNIEYRVGWQDGAEIVLAPRVTDATADTDLLLTFERDAAPPERYRIVRALETSEGAARLGRGAARFTGAGGIELFPTDRHALLSADGRTGSFAIDFWLHPTRVAEGAELFDVEATLLLGGRPVFQRLRLTIERQRLVWVLEDLVVRGGDAAPTPGGMLRLEARRLLVPDRWTHQMLAFDAATGRLSFSIDGRVEQIVHLDPSETIMIGSRPLRGFQLGSQFAGLLDEVRITRGAPPPLEEARLSGEPGLVVTEPIPLAGGARLERIDVRSVRPGRTEVRGSYRTMTETAGSALATDENEWRPLPIGGEIPGEPEVVAVQLRFELLADAARDTSPRLLGATITYRPLPPPPPPRNLRATSIADGILLEWDQVRGTAVAGYRVLLGEQPNRYLGTVGVASPIDAGSATQVRIEGLAADAPYVVAVESYDRFGRSAGLSRELEVRAGGPAP